MKGDEEQGGLPGMKGVPGEVEMKGAPGVAGPKGDTGTKDFLVQKGKPAAMVNLDQMVNLAHAAAHPTLLSLSTAKPTAPTLSQQWPALLEWIQFGLHCRKRLWPWTRSGCPRFMHPYVQPCTSLDVHWTHKQTLRLQLQKLVQLLVGKSVQSYRQGIAEGQEEVYMSRFSVCEIDVPTLTIHS